MWLCIHHNDLDGKCAAAIVGKFTPENVEYFETDYKDPLPENLEGKKVIIVDFSYKPDMMQRLLERVQTVIWIDHHETAKEYPYQMLPGLRNFDHPGYSGCELTWKYFSNNQMPKAVELIGDYDKWALVLPDSKAFYEGMKLEKNGPTEVIWTELLDPAYYQRCNQIIINGRTAQTYRDNYCNGLCKSFGYETEIDGHRAYACNQYMFGSPGFGHRFSQYPICIAYIHDGNRFTVSLYSESVHVGEIAKKYGGGGHKGAAGFTTDLLPFLKNPCK